MLAAEPADFSGQPGTACCTLQLLLMIVSQLQTTVGV